jgi:hypothetical protein
VPFGIAVKRKLPFLSEEVESDKTGLTLCSLTAAFGSAFWLKLSVIIPES